MYENRIIDTSIMNIGIREGGIHFQGVLNKMVVRIQVQLDL